MVSLENIAQTSNRKLTSLFNSPVSSSLRMEVLITNLLVAIERGEFKDEEEDELEQEVQEEEEEEMEDYERRTAKEEFWNPELIDLDYSNDVPSPLFDNCDESDSDDLVPSSTSPTKIRSRKSSSSKHGKNHQKMHLEDIEIEVVDEHWLSASPSKEALHRENYISAEEPSSPSSPQKSPLVIRIKVPMNSDSSDVESSPQKKRKREVGHDEHNGEEEDEPSGNQLQHSESDGWEDKRYCTEKMIIPSSAPSKKKLKAICDEREHARAQ